MVASKIYRKVHYKEQPIFRVLTIGAAMQQIILVDHDDFIINKQKISIGEKVDIDQIYYQLGGSGVNVAVTFARHGHQSIVISNLGQDRSAEAIKDFLIDESVDTSYLNQLPLQTGTSVVLLDSKTATRTTMNCLGAAKTSNNLEPNDLNLANPDWLYLTTLNGDLDKALELKQKKKVLGLLSDIDVLLVNQQETKMLVGGEILEELITKLSAYTKTVIITAGASGSIAKSGEEIYRLAEYEQKAPIDPTGAGDAFGSGFLAGLLDGLDFKHSLIAAAANATSVISEIGSTKGILSANEKYHPMPIQRLYL